MGLQPGCRLYCACCEVKRAGMRARTPPAHPTNQPTNHCLPPAACSESVESFKYITDQTDWGWGTRELARWAGAVLMWRIGQGLPKKYSIEVGGLSSTSVARALRSHNCPVAHTSVPPVRACISVYTCTCKAPPD